MSPIVRTVLVLALTAPASAAAEDLVYTVRPGETLSEIGNRLLADRTRWRELPKFNRIPDPNLLVPGSTLRIPVQMLATSAASATVIDARGTASVRTGDVLQEGTEVTTGENGFVTLRLADGSTTQLQASSALRLERLRILAGTDVQRSSLALLRGRIESLIERLRGANRTEITTPMGSTVVRGTRFRVGSDPTARVQQTEVLDGAVDVGGTLAPGKPEKLPAGFGTLVDADGRVAKPVALLAAPNLAGLAQLLQRTELQFDFAPLEGTLTYRAQVAADREFHGVVGESVSTSPRATFRNLPDGEYYLRVRGVDSRGLEGRDALHAFRLAAGPVPPAPTQPVHQDKVSGSSAWFSWTAMKEAMGYRFQLARDAEFREVVRDESSLTRIWLETNNLAPGVYYWRVASTRANGQPGPYSDVQQFSLRPRPPDPGMPEIDAKSLRFSWVGEPGQTFTFQLARDAAFTLLVHIQEAKEPRIEMPRPAAGQYFMRWRVHDPDGDVGPWTTPQKVDLMAGGSRP